MKTCFSALILVLVSTALHAQTTAFTYQGRLNEGSGPATGTYDLRFTIYDAPTGGSAVSGAITNAATSVNNGLFSATLDFGPGVFTGAGRWLEIGVRTNGGGVFTSLSPRQRITSTPYAITAGNITGNVSASQLTGSIAPANIAAGTITSTMLAAGSVTTSNLANGAVTLEKLNTSPVWTSSATFTNPTPAIGDYFGSALAAVGPDRVLIGAQWDDPGVYGAGAAYLFSTNGTLLTTITNPFPAQDDLFGLALGTVGGDKLIVGAYLKDVPGATNTGAAYLFNTNGTLLATFTNPTPVLDDNFGWAVAGVGADKVVIGANNESTGGASSGAAYVFSLNGTLLATIPNPTPAPGDQFGYQVAAFGSDRMLISSVLDDTGETNAGAVYLFRTNGTLLMTFTNPMPAQSLAFGLRIAAVDNDRVLISAALSDFTNGIVFLYSTNGTLLTTFGPATWIGTSLAWISPDKVAVGAQGDGAGSVRLFTTNGAPLATIANPTPDDGASFGSALAVFGDRLVVGVPLDDTGAIDAGVAQLFGIGAQYIPGLIGDASFAPSLGNLAIDSSRIVDGTIAEVDLADGAVSDVKISSVDASKLTGTILDALLSPNVALLIANQTFTGQNTFSNPGNSFTGNGAGLSGVNALTLGGIGSGGFWRTVGNAGTTPGANFLGTTDNQPLEIQVNGARALRIEPHGGAAPSLVGGYLQNSASGSHGAAIAGGGTSGSRNLALGNYAFVGAGHGGQAGAYSAVVGGAYNVSPGQFSFIGSGEGNTNAADFSFLGGGMSNYIAPGAVRTFLGGGLLNSNLAELATIAGGTRNRAIGPGSFIGGGGNNAALDFNTVISGGANNIAEINAATVGGGSENRASGDHSTIGGGQGNIASGGNATVGGGYGNTATGFGAFVGGGGQSGFFSSWPGNAVLGDLSAIGGGSGNGISGALSVISGGWDNTNSANFSVIGGGTANTNRGSYATVPGGTGNQAAGDYSFAAGRQAKANHQGSFVWADSQFANFASSGNNQFLLRAAGGVGINTTTPGAMLQVGDRNTHGSQGMIRFASHAGIGDGSREWDIGVPQHDFSIGGKFFSFVIDDPQLGTEPEVVVKWDTGNVGIGVTDPTSKLHVGAGGARFEMGVGRKFSLGGNGDFEIDAPGFVGGRFVVREDGRVHVGGTLANGNPKLISFGDGSLVRIGENIADDRMELGAGSFVFTNTAGNGRVGIGRVATVNRLEVEGEASKTTGGSWALNSDRRIKTDIQTITNALKKLEQVRLTSFRYTEEYRSRHPCIEDRHYINVIAQEFQSVFPEFVKGSGDKLPDGEEILQVDPFPLTIYAAAAVQELSQKMEKRETALRQELKRRDAENADLKKRLTALEEIVARLGGSR